ncbi:MAG: hypothetical protein IKA47_09505 [Oscillospiraceae bacterium]|nr:hypothetical protein [Oscillospiraceae bacterium]
MNSYSSLRKRNNGTGLAVVSLALCVVLTATVLFERLAAYATREEYHSIPLTRSGGITTVVAGRLEGDGEIRSRETQAMAPVVLSYSPFLSESWFRVVDENTVWQGETDIEIFRLSYENGEGSVTVQSGNGEKLLAPGTSNTYKFQLENTSDHPLEYTMDMEAYFSDGDHKIPVNARVFDKYGAYYAGTETEMVDVLDLNGVSDSGKLKAGYIMPYTLEWEWPFEEDDAYDTMLGNLAVEEDIALTIVINTTASYIPDSPVYDGEPPKTGDTMIMWAMGTMMASGAALLFLLALPRRKKKENEA